MLDKIDGGYYMPFRQYGRYAMEEFGKGMKALSDPNRVKLLKLLQRRRMFVCKIRAAIGIAQPTASKHLKVLETEGLWVNYTLSDGSRSPYAASLLGNLKHWLEGDQEIRDLFDRSGYLHPEDLHRHCE